jgi:hypothetical protein
MDESVDAWRAVCALAGEQCGALLKFPEDLVALELLGNRVLNQLDHALRIEIRVEFTDGRAELVERIVVLVRGAAAAERVTVPITAGDL